MTGSEILALGIGPRALLGDVGVVEPTVALSRLVAEVVGVEALAA